MINLTELFPPRPEPPQTSLSPRFQQLVDLAGRFVDHIPPVVIIESAPFTGRVDRYTYSQKVILISSSLETGLGLVERSEDQIARSLAHELGHIIDGRNYDNASFSDCEAAANSWRDKLLGMAARR